MPQLIFKGCKEQEVCELSRTLPPKLAAVSDTPEDYFTFECQLSRYYSAGKETNLYPLIEIQQFRRPDDVQKEMASCVAEAVHQLGYDLCEVYFLIIGDKDYHEFSW